MTGLGGMSGVELFPFVEGILGVEGTATDILGGEMVPLLDGFKLISSPYKTNQQQLIKFYLLYR